MTLRNTVIELLTQDPPNTSKALEVLETIKNQDLSPDAASLRLGILDVIERINQGADTGNVAALLTGLANGRYDDIKEIDIDMDLDDVNDPFPIEGLGLQIQKPNQSLPGPDQALLNALAARDSFTARMIAGDTVSDTEFEQYEHTLVELGKALVPLLQKHLDEEDAQGLMK